MAKLPEPNLEPDEVFVIEIEFTDNSFGPATIFCNLDSLTEGTMVGSMKDGFWTVIDATGTLRCINMAHVKMITMPNAAEILASIPRPSSIPRQSAFYGKG